MFEAQKRKLTKNSNKSFSPKYLLLDMTVTKFQKKKMTQKIAV